jgi:hypothetical protein
VSIQPSPDAGPPTDDAGVACPPKGSSCSVQGQTCGAAHCGSAQICEAQDPTKTPPGCPLSRRQYKDGIEYVDGAGLQELHDETIGIHLATYNYKAQYDDPNPKHLGFIIDDSPRQSPAVAWSRDRVDIYGYLSMVVATMQVQEKEIGELRRELESAREGKAACAAPIRVATPPASTQSLLPNE